MRAFNREEKLRIREKLLEQGRAVFGKYGLKKANVETIAKAAGIAKGSFYHFFESKEELYLEVLSRTSRRSRRQMYRKIFRSINEPEEAIKNCLLFSLNEIEADPVMKRLLEKDELEYVSTKLTPDVIKRHRNASLDSVVPFVKKWRENGQIQSAKPEAIVGALSALTLLAMHKDEIGTDIYPEIMELLVDAVVKGLTENRNSN